MEITELQRDAEPIEEALTQNLRSEVLTWRKARSLRHGMTATGVPVVRRVCLGQKKLKAAN